MFGKKQVLLKNIPELYKQGQPNSRTRVWDVERL